MYLPKALRAILLVLCLAASCPGYGQGPPITADKPIMLGGGATIFKTLTEVRVLERGTAVYAPLMAHYLPSSNTLVAVHLPFVDLEGDRGLADIKILSKFQFYRKDGKAKTLRMVLKSLTSLPTGRKLDLLDYSTGEWQQYFAVVAGREALRLGISAEAGYSLGFHEVPDELRVKFGLGVPLLKPTYPVNQLNLYFEWAMDYQPQLEGTTIKYAQGIQYARGTWTWETSFLVPLVQNNVFDRQKYTLLFGLRKII